MKKKTTALLNRVLELIRLPIFMPKLQDMHVMRRVFKERKLQNWEYLAEEKKFICFTKVPGVFCISKANLERNVVWQETFVMQIKWDELIMTKEKKKIRHLKKKISPVKLI